MAGDGFKNYLWYFGNEEEDSVFPNKHKMRKSRRLAVTMEKLTDVPRDIFESARDAYVTIVDLSRNRLTAIPDGLRELRDSCIEMVFSNNLIGTVPSYISQFSSLAQVNLSCNRLQELPPEFGLLKTLRELDISHNMFITLPTCIYKLHGLEMLLARNNCIKSIDATNEGLGALKRLVTLDLRYNDIDYVPPSLGTLRNLIYLEIQGNPFILPRCHTMDKGTESIMAYLRNHIPTE